MTPEARINQTVQHEISRLTNENLVNSVDAVLIFETVLETRFPKTMDLLGVFTARLVSPKVSHSV